MTKGPGILIGIDGGGSGCRVAIAEPDGKRLGEAQDGPANFTSDRNAALTHVRRALNAALAKAALSADILATAAAHAGLAGVQTEVDAAAVKSGLLIPHLVVTDDRPTAITGALGDDEGVLLAIGTGTIFGRKTGTDLRFVGGWGSRLSDHGSAAWLGRALLEQVLLARDGMRPETGLTRATFAAFERDPNALVYFARDAGAEALAAYAPSVTEAADAGDVTGLTLMRAGATALSDALTALDPDARLPVCLTGGLGPRYAPYLTEMVRARLIVPKGSPLDGALLLASQGNNQNATPSLATGATPIRAIAAPRIFDGRYLHEGKALVFEGATPPHLADEADLPAGAALRRYPTGLLAPAFVDLQVNGGGGMMFNDATDLAGLTTIAMAHASLGTGGILPTLITDTPEKTRAAVDAVAEAVASGLPVILGLHLEGPHIAGPRKGAHDASLIRPMTDADETLLTEAAARLPNLMVTIAPEVVRPERIARLTKAGVIVSLGHSDADAHTVERAFAAGARAVTHLFNAMSQLQGRAPGVVGATLANTAVAAGLIADGIHVDLASIRSALNAKPEGLFLVTDAMATLGSDIDRFSLNGREIRLADGRLTLADGTLAGAHISLPQSVRLLAETLGLDLATALRMATSHPAGVLRRPMGSGHVTGGRIVHLDDDWTARLVEPPPA